MGFLSTFMGGPIEIIKDLSGGGRGNGGQQWGGVRSRGGDEVVGSPWFQPQQMVQMQTPDAVECDSFGFSNTVTGF